jgi:DNA-binding transcriptional LysR family regulator
LKLEALQVFCDVTRLHSFSRGGEASGVSQSAASQIVAGLEEELGFELFDRSRRPLELTEEGRLYYHGCQELLHRHRALVEEIQRNANHPQGTVHVASIYSAGLHSLTRYIQRFMTEHPDFRVRLEYLLPHKVYDAVLNDEADLGVVSYPKVHRELDIVPWLEEEMQLVCPRDHRLSQRASVPIRELEGEKFVAFDRDLMIRKAIDRTLRQHHVDVQVVSEFDNIETIKQALEISNAVSILPRASVEREVQRGMLVEVVIEGIELRRPVGIIHRRRKPLTPTARRFLESILAGRSHTGDEGAPSGRRPRETV